MTPLVGKRIVVTRPRAQAADLCNRLTALGAIPISFPTIEIEPLADSTELDQAIRNLSSYDWIVFTSVNGVNIFSDLSGLANKIAAIGPATAQALQQRGATVSLVPPSYIAESLVESLDDVRGQRILIPRAEVARDVLKVGLEQRGALVNEIATYRAQPVVPDPQALDELNQGVDAITFTSSSTVRNFITRVGQIDNLPYPPAIICIGPITAQTARELGLIVAAIATVYTTDGLVTALLHYFSHPEQTHVNVDPQPSITRR